jgi:hypothetical protein
MNHLRLPFALILWLLLLIGCNSVNPTPSGTNRPISPSPFNPNTSATRTTELPTAQNPNSNPRPTASPPQVTSTPITPPSPTPTPALRRLTEGGCCVDTFWSTDSQQLLYIDRPSPDGNAGLWAVNVQGSEPQFITDRLGIYSPDMQLRAFPQDGATYIENLSTGELWNIPNGGRAVSFSPDQTWLAWTAGQTGPPFNTARRDIWISSLDGSQERMVFSGMRAGFEGWFPDGRILVSGLVEGSDSEQALWVLDQDQAEEGRSNLVELGRGARIRGASLSPGGDWVAYLTTFSADPAQDGIWLADARTGERRRLDVFGGYQWRDAQHLLVVPLDLSQPVHRLLQVEAASGQVQSVTDPAITPFKIANGDWSVSPDGELIAFVSADEGNIWLLELPD